MTTATTLNATTALTALYLPGWRAEFADYPVADMPALPTAWQDISWHNDACPSFLIAGNNDRQRLRGWVDYLDPTQRENGPDMPRFIVQWDEADGTAGRVAYEGEDAAEFIAVGQLERLAYGFAMGLRRFLSAEDWQALRLANRTSTPGGCNANDFCDANVVMLEAFTAITGRDPLASGDGFADADMVVFNEAWDIARRHHLTADGEGERFDAWRTTGRDVADLDAAGVETGRVDGDATVTAGRVYGPGFLSRMADGRWHCLVSNHDDVFDHLDDAETYLWSNYASGEWEPVAVAARKRAAAAPPTPRRNRFATAIVNARIALSMLPNNAENVAALDAILAQHGCETFDPAAPYLTDLISIVIDG